MFFLGFGFLHATGSQFLLPCCTISLKYIRGFTRTYLNWIYIRKPDDIKLIRQYLHKSLYYWTPVKLNSLSSFNISYMYELELAKQFVWATTSKSKFKHRKGSNLLSATHAPLHFLPASNYRQKGLILCRTLAYKACMRAGFGTSDSSSCFVNGFKGLKLTP